MDIMLPSSFQREIEARGVTKYRFLKLLGRIPSRDMGPMNRALRGKKTIKIDTLQKWIDIINVYAEENCPAGKPFIPMTIDDLDFDPVTVRLK